MFKSIVAQAKRAVTDTAERLLGRAVVGLLLVVAGGFATAALMIKLTEAWGAVIACLVVAGMFALIALIAPLRASLADLSAHPEEIDRLLAIGADNARDLAAPTLQAAYRAVGLRP